MASQEDGFHEIQLNGKQLVFLFMAATVVSVVIFLCGVLVGRGVRTERSAAQPDAVATLPATDTAVASTAAPPPVGTASDPTKAAPPPPVDDVVSRLDKEKPPAETIKPPAKAGKSAPEKSAPPAPAASAPPAASSPVAASMHPMPTPWTVQIAALNVRSQADAVAHRLSSKGYPAYVVAPTDGTSVFRVRVGRFGTRREAETLSAKLEKDEQIKPFITR